MKKILLTIFSLVIFSTSLFYVQGDVLAQSAKPNLKDAFKISKTVGENSGYSTKDLDLIEIVITAIQLVLSVLGIIFIIFIIYSGFSWMMAGGNEETVTKAKRVLKNAAIGLVVVIGAYAISYFVVSSFSFLYK